jgi:ferredoxin-type protein NapH
MRSPMQSYMFWVFLAFLAVGVFYPAVGVIALTCMLAPVIVAFWRGRWWCGNVCPRGSFYDQLLRRISPQKKTPAFFRHPWFRAFMVAFIFVMFSVQMHAAWGNISAMGMVFLVLIGVTTLAAILLGLFFNSRTWCNFCPMGTLAMLVTRFRRRSRAL